MKFIHCADLHLASALDSRLSKEKARLRRRELLDTFERLAERAREEKVTAVLIAGDIFDEEKVLVSAKRHFLKIVARFPEVDFLCLSGNHDRSLSEEGNLPENLKTFEDQWTKYSYGEVDIYGIEQTNENCALLYNSLFADNSKVNLVMLHGQTIDSRSEPAADTVILPMLKNKNIDYLALGHIHSYKQGRLDERGVYCYSGCLEGRGYDETGKKGFVMLDVSGNTVRSTFVPFAKRMIHGITVDVSGLEDGFDVEKKVLAHLALLENDDLVRVELTGSVGSKAQIYPEDLEKKLKERFFHARVKNNTTLKIDPEEYREEMSLKGAFIRKVLASDLSEEDQARVIRQGLRALSGEEVEEH